MNRLSPKICATVSDEVYGVENNVQLAIAFRKAQLGVQKFGESLHRAVLLADTGYGTIKKRHGQVLAFWRRTMI